MEKYTITLGEIIENDVNIFDFNYPFYNEALRGQFEKTFIDYFYFDEIGFETVSRFKHFLKVKLNLVMPFWNEIYKSQDLEYDILNNYNIDEIYDRTIINDSENETSATNKNLYKDAPKTKIDIERIDNVNSIEKNISDINTRNSNESVERWKRSMIGNIGVQSGSDLIVKYWESRRKVTEELFEKELSDLFMGVY